MNGISWIIYSAEMVGRVGFTFGLLSFITAIIAGISLIIGAVLAGNPITPDEVVKGKNLISVSKKFGISAILFAFMASVIPSKQTIYLIGASQAGEQILQLQEVQEVGGEAGALASDLITLMRQMVSEQLEETE